MIWGDFFQVELFFLEIGNFQWFEVTIGHFQWFLRIPLPLNVFRQSDHCHQLFSMVRDYWSNDAMVSMDRCINQQPRQPWLGDQRVFFNF